MRASHPPAGVRSPPTSGLVVTLALAARRADYDGPRVHNNGMKTPGPANGTRRLDRDDRTDQDAVGAAESLGIGAASLGAATLGAATLGSTVAAGLDPPAGVHAMRAAPRARARSKRVHMGSTSWRSITAATARGVANRPVSANRRLDPRGAMATLVSRRTGQKFQAARRLGVVMRA